LIYTFSHFINENQNTRTYNLSAALSNSGISYQTKYSNTVLDNQRYIAVRQGSIAEPLGNIVISINE
jgi:hypothetical protein